MTRNKIYFTPGPSQVYPTVKNHLLNAFEEGVPSISHRSKTFEGIFKECTENLREVLSIPKEHSIFFTGSATAVWDILSLNAIENKSFHLVNGSFSKRFYETVGEWKKDAAAHDVNDGFGFRANEIKVPEDADLLALILNETSTGVQMPSEEIVALRKTNPRVTLVADGVSAFPAYQLDFRNVDAAYFSVQKGFGLPAGLGVLVAAPALLEKAELLRKKGFPVGSYQSLHAITEKAASNQTPETPNVLGIYLLAKVTGDMLKKGMNIIRNESKQKAEILYNALQSKQGLSPFVQNKPDQSETVIVAEVEGGAEHLIARLKEEGIILATGYGKHKSSQIRIANFPATSVEDVEELAGLL